MFVAIMSLSRYMLLTLVRKPVESEVLPSALSSSLTATKLVRLRSSLQDYNTEDRAFDCDVDATLYQILC